MNTADQCVGKAADSRSCWRNVVGVWATLPLCRVHREEAAAALVVPAPGPVVDSVVYYLGHPATQQVKIGTTTDIAGRWYTLNAERPGLVLLATEPGSFEVERMRHAQFKILRIERRNEWFRKAPLLMEHVGRMRLAHGVLGTVSRVPVRAVAELQERANGRHGE